MACRLERWEVERGAWNLYRIGEWEDSRWVDGNG